MPCGAKGSGEGCPYLVLMLEALGVDAPTREILLLRTHHRLLEVGEAS